MWPRIWTHRMIAVLLLVGCGVLVTRGVVRAVHDSGDLAPVVMGAHLFGAGQNPYDSRVVGAHWAARGLPGDPNWQTTPVAYPPGVWQAR
jgi:hypothetical protein